MKKNSPDLSVLLEKIQTSHAIVIGAGAGLSSAAGLTYSGERFQRYFSDFSKKYEISDIYSGGFYPFQREEEQWGWWCRHIYYNRYEPDPLPLYKGLYDLVSDKNYFVLTTNVDHQFQKSGFSTEKIFYTQGDYGRFQCSIPCKQETFSNQSVVEEMISKQVGMEIPTELIPRCPYCGADVTPHLRKDHSFVEDTHWMDASNRYTAFLKENQDKKLLFLELGVGLNTPDIIKFPFWRMTHSFPHSFLVSLNQEQPHIPKELEGKSLFLRGDLGTLLKKT